MSTAPKDGTAVILGDDDVGEYIMRWMPTARNSLFLRVRGMWVALDGSFTWIDDLDNGPEYWRPWVRN